MTAYLKNIDTGYPGAMSRAHEGGYTVKTEIAGPLTQFQYGQPVLLNTLDNTINLYDHAKAATERFAGFVVRPFPKQGQATIANVADSSYEGEAHSVMQRGYMTAMLRGATAVTRGTPVSVCTVAGADALAGDLVGTTAGTSAVIDYAFFNGDAAPGEIVEIEFNVLLA